MLICVLLNKTKTLDLAKALIKILKIIAGLLPLPSNVNSDVVSMLSLD